MSALDQSSNVIDAMFQQLLAKDVDISNKALPDHAPKFVQGYAGGARWWVRMAGAGAGKMGHQINNIKISSFVFISHLTNFSYSVFIYIACFFLCHFVFEKEPARFKM